MFFDRSAKVFEWNVVVCYTGALRLVVKPLRVVLTKFRCRLLVRVGVPHTKTTIPLAVLPLLDSPSLSLTAA